MNLYNLLSFAFAAYNTAGGQAARMLTTKSLRKAARGDYGKEEAKERGG
jgi:hypothetical protein